MTNDTDQSPSGKDRCPCGSGKKFKKCSIGAGGGDVAGLPTLYFASFL